MTLEELKKLIADAEGKTLEESRGTDRIGGVEMVE